MSPLSDTLTLSEIELFRGLAPKQMSWLNDHVHRKAVPAGTNIVSAEQPGEALYIILNGTVKISVGQMNGTDVILTILGPGDVVGEMSLLDGDGRSADAVTLEETTLLWMDRGTLQECMRTMPAVTTNMMRILCNRLRQAGQQIQALAALDVRGRVARQLLTFAQQYGQVTASGGTLIPIRLTQSDIASLVGASRERVNRIITGYKRRQYLSVDRDYRITVHDQAALAQRCDLPAPQQQMLAHAAAPM